MKVEVLVKEHPIHKAKSVTVDLPASGTFVKICDGVHVRLVKEKEKA